MSFVGKASSFAAGSALVTYNGIFIILVEQCNFAGFFSFFPLDGPSMLPSTP